MSSLDLEPFTSFGDLLKFLRRRAGLTQRELSIAVGYSVPQISRLEQNQRLPDLATIGARFVPALDLDDQPRAAERLRELAAAVRREDAPAPGLPPFKGLFYFDESDADLFFGREALTESLAARVTEPPSPSLRFLAVVGASGSGKSSLVRAGLIPALRWRTATAGWPVVVLTPTAHPLEALAASLLAEGKTGSTTLKLAANLRQDAAALARQIGSAPAVLVVDQFEELFTLCRDEAEQAFFVDNLLAAAGAPGGAAWLVIALRADFYAHCARFDGLREGLARQQAFIGPMTAAELRRAIEEPARRGHWELESGLVEVLLKDVGADGAHPPEPGALPLLSHALLETWLRRRGQTLTLSGYAASGGVRGAIAETAEAVFHDQLDGSQRAIARQIFLRLTELGVDGATADTRRRAALAELIPGTVDSGASADAVREVLQTLADARLITTEQDAAEVAHEALIREWPTLRGWLEEDRDGLRLHRGLTEAAQEWARLEREPGALYRGVKLAQALEWAGAEQNAPSLNALEREYLEASRADEEREAIEREAARQRELNAARKLAETERAQAEDQKRAAGQLRRRALYLLGALIVAVVLAGAALYLGDRARQIATSAQAASRLATARELAADADNNLDVDPERSVLLALQALSFGDTPETEGALHQAVMADRLQLTLAGHQGDVWQLAYSPDGQRLATTQNNQATVWDAVTGKQLLAFTGHTISINGIAFSPDGTRIATASDDHTAKVWDAATGRVLFTVNHDAQVLRLAFSPDGTRLATTSWDQTTKIWDAKTGQGLTTLPGTGMMFGIAYSRDGTRLAVTDWGGPVQIWDTTTWKLLRTLQANDTGVDDRAVAFSPDGKQVAAAATNQVNVWDTASGRELMTLTADQDGVRAIAYSPDGKYLVTAGLDRKAIFWDAATGQQLFTLAGHAGPINDIAFSPDGQHLATSSWDSTAKVWNLAAEHELLTIAAPDLVPGYNPALALTRDGSRLAVSSFDAPVKLFDTVSGRRLLTLHGDNTGNNNIAFSPDGKRVVTASWDASTAVWDTATGQSLFALNELAAGVAFSPDGKRVAITDRGDDAMSVRDSATGQVIWSETEPGKLFAAVAYSPDGTRLASATAFSNSSNPVGYVVVWDAATGKQLLNFLGHSEPVIHVQFSSDNTRLATSSFDGTAKIWDVGTGKELLTLAGQTGPTAGLAFSPDGKRLAIGSVDGTTKIWDATTGQELLALHGDGTSMNDLAFSPDGTRLYAVTEKAVYVYALKVDDLVALAKSRVTRSLTTAECQQYLHVTTCPTGQ